MKLALTKMRKKGKYRSGVCFAHVSLRNLSVMSCTQLDNEFELKGEVLAGES